MHSKCNCNTTYELNKLLHYTVNEKAKDLNESN